MPSNLKGEGDSILSFRWQLGDLSLGLIGGVLNSEEGGL